jgi:hypothetical protein
MKNPNICRVAALCTAGKIDQEYSRQARLGTCNQVNHFQTLSAGTPIRRRRIYDASLQFLPSKLRYVQSPRTSANQPNVPPVRYQPTPLVILLSLELLPVTASFLPIYIYHLE